MALQEAVKPVVKEGLLWTGETKSDNAPIVPNSAEWDAWLAEHDQFRFVGASGHFSARRERRSGGDYWYAYRRRDGVLHKAYLGKADDLTLERMEEVAAGLAGWAVLAQLSLAADAPGRPNGDSWLGDTSFTGLAKFRPPTLPPTLVTRPRLTDNINTPVTIIAAPGGTGKTTILNAWRQQRDGRGGADAVVVAWVALEQEDNQLLPFWATVVMALQAALGAVQPGLGQQLLPFLQRSSPIAPAEIVARLADELARATATAGPLALVLDDFHHIQSADIHTSVQLLMEHLPPSVQLILAGRTRPPLALGRLRAMGVVTELDADELRFTLPEGISFLQQHITAEPLAYGDMETLVRRTGGWVAGLKLAVLALNKQPDRRRVIDTFSGAHVFLREYFTETALRQQPEAVQSFLLKTSILKQLTGGLCDAVTGQSDGAGMLARLWQDNLFITCTEDQTWYRYHDLFAEMLSSQLQRQWPDQIDDLHRRAATWYVAHDMSADAVNHLLFIEDWETAAEVIEDVGLRELAESGEDSRLLRWVQRLPETVVQRHKTLLFVYLRLANLALPRDEVTRFLHCIEQNLTTKSPAALTADEREVLDEVRQITHRLVAQDVILPASHLPDQRWQLLDALLITETFYKPKTDEVGARVREIYNQARAEGNLFATIFAGTDLSNRALVRGQLRQSEKLAYQVLQQCLLQRGHLPEPASIALALLAQVCLARNDLTRAHQLLDRALVVDPNPTSSNMPLTIAMIRARLQSAEGRHTEAEATMAAARTLQALHPAGAWRDRDLVAHEARIRARQGDWEAAWQLLIEAETDEPHALSQLVAAEIQLAREQSGAAESLLAQFVAQYPAGFPNESSLEARLLWARALSAQGKMNQAHRVLAEAVRLAAAEGYLRPFLDQGRPLVPLLALMLHMGALPADGERFISEVLRLLEGSSLSLHPSSFAHMPAEGLDAVATATSITAREQEVLRLLSEGLSNREIADRLCVSVGTIKTHLTNIYGKLGVNSRMQAVAEAQALRVL
ncbi:MAG: AAA family ATPase [Anaerolineae bacterium]|nr:AAA family ATPase [Anaerolineae bacterium]